MKPAAAISAATITDTPLRQMPVWVPGSRQFKPKTGLSTAGIAVMVAVHGLLGYALVSGMATKAIEVIKKPLNATIIAEVRLPPPPPPPPPKIEKIEVASKEAAPPPPSYVPPPDIAAPPAAAPAITAVQTTQVVAPPPVGPPTAPAPPAPAAPSRSDIALVCPKQVKPEIPKRAIDDGVEGTVKAEVRVRSGKVVGVTIISGPRAYHASVRAAIARYECSNSNGDQEVTATQDFTFKLE